MKSRLIAGSLLLFAGVSLHAQATTVLNLSLEEKTEMAPLVVRGRVLNLRAAELPRMGPVSLVQVETLETLKGQPTSARFEVVKPGGLDGHRLTRVFGTARYTEGEEVLLFLEPLPKSIAKAYVAIGVGIGTYHIDRSVKPAVVRLSPGAHALDGAASKPHKHGQGLNQDDGLSLAVVLKRIHAQLDKEGGR